MQGDLEAGAGKRLLNEGVANTMVSSPEAAMFVRERRRTKSERAKLQNGRLTGSKRYQSIGDTIVQ
jgi:hypothetical protein